MAIDEYAHRSPIIGPLRMQPEDTDESLKPDHDTGQSAISPDQTVDVIVEINGLYPGGYDVVIRSFHDLWEHGGIPGLPEVEKDRRFDLVPGLRRLTATQFQTAMSPRQAADLVALDRRLADGGPTIIFKIWPDYPLEPLIDRSAPTIKVDAAHLSYTALGAGIVWAVIDSGIQADHLHFAELELAREDDPDAVIVRTRGLHRDFTALVEPSQPRTTAASGPLVDELGHGTHVAGIIAGHCPADSTLVQVASSDEPPGGGFVARSRTGVLSGMAPKCELVSLKVFRKVNGAWKTSFSAVIAALEYLRSEVNITPGVLRVHGVNLSLGCDWDPSHYAAGQSPLCQLVNRLVDSGVVVVVSAGNSGKALSQADSNVSVMVMGSITEPAHAEGCITVGSTHRDSPHTFGISWTSSKGPTLDGRSKPDVVAPGEWITSAVAGSYRAKAGPFDPAKPATYAEQSGTSMAAPHVSGVIAGFLSARPEFIGRPRLVKKALMSSAVDLGRERHAQGAGLVDAMAMLSS